MPPKIDPYASPRARIFDLILILFTLLVIALVLLTAPQRRSGTGAAIPPANTAAPVLLASSTGH